jgi:hypothetical protein
MKKTKQATSLPQRNERGQFVKGVCGCPEKKLKPGHPYRFPPGVSGNPAGTSKRRADFERAFYDALMGQGTPEEASKLLWDAARAKEPWGVQMLLDRIAPKDSKLKLEVSRGQDDGFDYGKLSDEQIRQLEAILEHAGVQPREIEGGEGPEEPV